MKKFFNLSIMAMIVLSAILFGTSCGDNDKDDVNPEGSVQFTELPGAARLFVQNHFDEKDIDLISRSTSEGTEGYNVSVKGYKIDFDKDGPKKQLHLLPPHMWTK